MSINKLLLIVITTLSSAVFANDSALIERKKSIIDNNPSYEFNMQLKQTSPMVYEVMHDIERLKQLEEIKVLLQKIVDFHEILVTTAQD
jgi:hypothetical protein